MKINLNVDVTGINPNLFKKPFTDEQVKDYNDKLKAHNEDSTKPMPEVPDNGSITSPELAVLIIKKCMLEYQEKGNTGHLRLVAGITKNLDEQKKKGTVELSPDHVSFIRKCIGKAQWTMTDTDLTNFVLKVEEAFTPKA